MEMAAIMGMVAIMLFILMALYYFFGWFMFEPLKLYAARRWSELISAALLPIVIVGIIISIMLLKNVGPGKRYIRRNLETIELEYLERIKSGDIETTDRDIT